MITRLVTFFYHCFLDKRHEACNPSTFFHLPAESLCVTVSEKIEFRFISVHIISTNDATRLFKAVFGLWIFADVCTETAVAGLGNKTYDTLSLRLGDSGGYHSGQDFN